MAACTRHADRETLLICTACDRPFCHECLIQGPVGAKCRDCTRGIPIGATGAERARASVRANDRDRMLSLRILVAALLAANVIMFVGSNDAGTAGRTRAGGAGLSSSPLDYALLAGPIRDGDWWRLFTGAVAASNVITMLLAAASAWWVGRRVAPRLGHARFWALVAASTAGGAFVLLLVRPDSPGYGALAVPGGLAGAYLAARRRTVVGALALPAAGRLGYGVFFLLWFVGGSVLSEPSALLGLAGGALAGAPLAWFLFAPPRDGNPRWGAAVASLAAVVLFGAAAAQASAAGDPVAGSSTSAARSADAALADATASASADTGSGADGEWLSVSSWGDARNTDDVQTYRLRCRPTPDVIDVTGVGGVPDPTAACAWLDAHRQALTARATIAPSERCASAPVRRLALAGSFDGITVGAVLDTADGCTAEVAAGADAALRYG